MQGTLRVLFGILIAFGSVGTLETDPSASLVQQSILGLVGVAIMISGVSAMKGARR